MLIVLLVITGIAVIAYVDWVVRALSLGLFDGMKYESEQVRLGSNDIIALYSDGIVEAENQRGEEFTSERLAKLIASHDALTAEELLDSIFTAVADFTQHQFPADDQTLLVLKVE